MSSQPSPHLARHLLRALLRECSYLPDPVARLQLSRHVLHRFRANRKLDLQAGNVRPERLPQDQSVAATPEKRAEALLKTARKSLNHLRKANNGESGPLLHVLLSAYGRTGKRRMELLTPLLKPDTVQSDVPASQPLSAPANAALRDYLDTETSCMPFLELLDKRDSYEFKLSGRCSKLKAVAASQTTLSVPTLTRPRLRRLNLSVPKKNVWERPMPRKRVKNAVRRWFADLLNRVLPPLPRAEWDRLNGLIAGTVKWDGVPKRRPGVGLRPCELQGPQLRDALDSSTDKNFQKEASLTVLENSLGLQKIQVNFPGKDQPHNLTLRYMKRMWAKVLSQSCLMTWDSTRGSWYCKWGYKRPQFPAMDEVVFQGVDTKGRVPLKPRRPSRESLTARQTHQKTAALYKQSL